MYQQYFKQIGTARLSFGLRSCTRWPKFESIFQLTYLFQCVSLYHGQSTHGGSLETEWKGAYLTKYPMRTEQYTHRVIFKQRNNHVMVHVAPATTHWYDVKTPSHQQPTRPGLAWRYHTKTHRKHFSNRARTTPSLELPHKQTTNQPGVQWGNNLSKYDMWNAQRKQTPLSNATSRFKTIWV